MHPTHLTQQPHLQLASKDSSSQLNGTSKIREVYGEFTPNLARESGSASQICELENPDIKIEQQPPSVQDISLLTTKLARDIRADIADRGDGIEARWAINFPEPVSATQTDVYQR
ncbi:hypothetical protein J6590_106211 [Homalodisca vitripennis]|nr:hypothetical protein J6590_106211 [Homalodisca vitripennis]